MAQTNYTPIILYNSGTTGNTPSTSNLASGELAINYTDGKLFYKDNSSTLQVIGWKTTPTTAGGTGLTSYTAGDLPYYSSGTALSKLGIGTSGYVLESNGSAPTWVAQSTLSVGTATNATNTAITDNTSSSATWYPTIVSATTGNLPQTTSSTKFSFVPSTGALSATSFSGSGSGLTNIPGSSITGSNSLSTTVFPSSTIIQVLQSTLTSQFSTSSTSFVSSGLAVSITPQFSTSKILIQVCGDFYISSAAGYSVVTVYRGSTNLGTTASGLFMIGGSNDVGGTACIIDSPATTSSTTYTVYIKSGSGLYTAYINDTAGSSQYTTTSITVMEIR